MSKRKTKINTVRFPDDVAIGVANIAHGTGWSLNVATAKLLRLALAWMTNDPHNQFLQAQEIHHAIRAHAIREQAECQIKQLKAEAPPAPKAKRKIPTANTHPQTAT